MTHDEMVSMPSLFKGPSMDSLFVSVARALLDRGEVRETRGTKSLELSDAWLVLTDPSRSVVTLKERRLTLKCRSSQNSSATFWLSSAKEMLLRYSLSDR